MTRPPEVDARWRFAAAAVLGIALVVAAYGNSLDNAFQFDDAHVIQENLAIRSLGNLPRFFTDATTFSTIPAHQTYRPLLSTTYAIDYWIAGELDPKVFHLSQLLFHLLVGLGVFLLVRATADATLPGPGNRWVALAAAAWFGIHTGNTETVNYLSARSDILSTLGIVGSFATYVYVPGSRRFHVYLIPMLIGALAKPPAVMFAPLLLVWILLFEEGVSPDRVASTREGARVWPAIVRALPAFAVAGLAFLFVEAMNPEGQTYGGTSALGYLRTQAWVWLHYLRLFVLPVGLTADTDWDIVPAWTDTRVVAGLGVLALLAWVAVRASRVPEWRPIAFGLAWFALGLLPSSSVVPLAEVANEHRVYLPFVGLVLASSWAFLPLARASAERRGRLAPAWAIVPAAILVAHLVGTVTRNRVWRTEESLWADVVAKSPGNGRAWMNLGLTRMEEGRYEEARDLFVEAAERWPAYAPAYINLGLATFRLGDTATADGYFRRAMQMNTVPESAPFFYGRFLTEAGRGPEGLAMLQEAVARTPTYLPARSYLLKLYYVIGSRTEVEALARGTLAMFAGDSMALAFLEGRPPVGGAAANVYDRGVALTAEARHLDAGVAYRRYLDETGPDADAFLNLGWSQAKLGFDALAAISFREVLAIRPDDALARNNLTWVEQRMGGTGIVTPP